MVGLAVTLTAVITTTEDIKATAQGTTKSNPQMFVKVESILSVTYVTVRSGLEHTAISKQPPCQQSFTADVALKHARVCSLI